jgi:heme oxygenase
MTDHDANLVARLHRAEHFLRHAVEGEYHANSVMKAIFAYEDQSEALAKADDANLVASTITRQAAQITTLTQILHNIHALAHADPVVRELAQRGLDAVGATTPPPALEPTISR